MLGENHCLVNEFPTYKSEISALIETDQSFANDAKQYHALDSEIRALELDNAPIDDEALHMLKHNRSVLKDTLYQQIVKK